MSSKPPQNLSAPVRPATTAPALAAIADQLNSSCDPSSGARVLSLAKAFGRAKSQAHRDDDAAKMYGKELCLTAKIVRLNLGYTRQELANECDVGLSVIAAMEDGFVPSISIINRAYSFLGFDLLSALVGEAL